MQHVTPPPRCFSIATRIGTQLESGQPVGDFVGHNLCACARDSGAYLLGEHVRTLPLPAGFALLVEDFVCAQDFSVINSALEA